ncbi:MAG: HEAT repeat domain-containing protein [Bradymonadia bacterium]
MRALSLACLSAAALMACGEEPARQRSATTQEDAAAPASGPDAQVKAPALSSPPLDGVPPPVEVKPPVLSPEAQLEALKKAKSELNEGRTRAAYRIFKSAMNGPDLGIKLSAGLAAAELAELEGEVKEAQALYERLINLGSEVAEVHLLAGRFFHRTGDSARGIDALRAATNLQPDLLPAWLSLGQVLIERGRHDEGATALVQYERRLNALSRQLEDEQVPLGDRLAIVQLLGTLNDERSTALLIKLLKHHGPLIRASAGEALAQDDDPEALVALSEAALQERDPEVKRALTGAMLQAREAVRRSLKPEAP